MIRLAHITDLHLRNAIPGTAPTAVRRSRTAMQHLTEALEEVARQKVDFLAVTGDLVDVPDFLTEGMPRGCEMPEFCTWEPKVREDYRPVKELLERTGIPYRVLPGNHDHPAIFREIFPGHDAEIVCKGYRIVPFHDYEHDGHVPRRYLASRLLFDAVLNDANLAPQIHLQHYLFRPVPNADYPYAYAEHAFLRKRIGESGRVRLCLSGHYHKGLFEPGATTYAVTPAFCHADRTWRIYELDESGVRFETFSRPLPPPQPVVFLDRDGVINDLDAYWYGPEEMRLIPGAAQAIRRLNQAGYAVVVVTNQSAIGYGFVSEPIVRAVHERMHALLAAGGAFVDAVYYTKSGGPENNVVPGWDHLPTAKSSIVLQALNELPLDRDRSWIVGDRLTDLEAGEEAGLKAGFLVQTGRGRSEAAKATKPVIVVADLAAAMEKILGVA